MTVHISGDGDFFYQSLPVSFSPAMTFPTSVTVEITQVVVKATVHYQVREQACLRPGQSDLLTVRV